MLIYTSHDEDAEPLNLLDIKRRMKPNEKLSINVFIGKEKIATRLIIERVPTRVADAKRRRLKWNKDHKGKNSSKERLELCDLNLHITNTTEKQLHCNKVREYYSLRWQIEILFKAWKSVYKIDKVKKMKVERFECINYGAMLLILITTDLLAYCKYVLYQESKKEISELKTFKIVKSLITELKAALESTKFEIENYIDKLYDNIKRTGIKQQKNGRKSPYRILAGT